MTGAKCEPAKDSSPQYSDISKSSGVKTYHFNLHFINLSPLVCIIFSYLVSLTRIKSNACAFIDLFQDAHESGSDKDDSDRCGQEVRKTHQEPETEAVSIAERTSQTPAGTLGEMDTRPNHVISVITDGAGCCKTRDSEMEQLSKLRSALSASSPELKGHVQDPGTSNSLFHSARVNAWYSSATVDTAVPCGLGLAVPGRTQFPICLQQHALVQVGLFLGVPLVNDPADSH